MRRQKEKVLESFVSLFGMSRPNHSLCWYYQLFPDTYSNHGSRTKVIANVTAHKHTYISAYAYTQHAHYIKCECSAILRCGWNVTKLRENNIFKQNAHYNPRREMKHKRIRKCAHVSYSSSSVFTVCTVSNNNVINNHNSNFKCQEQSWNTGLASKGSNFQEHMQQFSPYNFTAYFEAYLSSS